MSEREATLNEISSQSAESAEGRPRLVTGVSWTELDYIPSDWDIINLGSKITVTTGNNFKSQNFDDSEGTPLVRIRDLGRDETSVNFTGDFDDKYLVENYDLLVGMDGEFEPHLWTGGESVLNQRVCRIEPDETYNKFYLRHAIEKALYYIQTSVAGTTVKHLSQSDINDINLPTPSIDEQRKIASVLYTVDQAIQKTEVIIEQLRRVRTGVTQNIFTTGFFEHEETKNVRLGPIKTSIPEDWELRAIPDSFDIIDGDRGKNYPGQDEFFDDGYCLFLSAENVTDEGLKFNETEFISKEKDKELRKGKLSRGDIVMTTRGTVGNFGIYDENIFYDHLRINSGMVILRPKNRVTYPKFYYYQFQSGIFQKQIEATSYGTAQPQTSVTDIQKMRIIEPRDEEKENIEKLIENLNSAIYSNQGYRCHLQNLKQGLMQDLLSGEVRTNDKDIQIVDEVLAHG